MESISSYRISHYRRLPTIFVFPGNALSSARHRRTNTWDLLMALQTPDVSRLASKAERTSLDQRKSWHWEINYYETHHRVGQDQGRTR